MPILVTVLKSGFQSGYRQTSLAVNRFFNICLSLALIIICLPLFAVIGLVVWITSGRPIFYCGQRLGLGKQLFTMYKFRTLVPNAEILLREELCQRSHGLTTPIGNLLRNTRMDELPQLFNVLRGDMDFLGPRPERPEVYEKICRFIPGYDLRFEVAPGLLGFSQIFTPHSSPKRIRTFVDNRLVRKKQRIFWDVFEIFITGAVVAQAGISRLAQAFYYDLILRRLVGAYSEKRLLEREKTRRSTAHFRAGNPGDYAQKAELVDINEKAFLIRSPHAIDFPAAKPRKDSSEQGEVFVLSVNFKGRAGKIRHKTAHCHGYLHRANRKRNGMHEYVIFYSPKSPLSFYIIRQYFMKESLASFVR